MRRVFDFWWGQGIADDVPALAYYLVLSLAPFALGLAALQALLLKDVLSAYQVASQINRFLPEAVHDDVRGLVVGTRDNSPLLIALAVGSMLWTTSGAIGVIERCESRLLDCRRHDVVTGRIRNIGLGAMVAVMFVAAASGAPVISEAASALSLSGTLPRWLVLALNALGSVVLIAAVFRYAPRSRIAWRPALLGALPAGVAIQGIPALVGLYFGAAAGFAAVRLFLLLAVLLGGLYVVAMVMLIGAGLAVRGELHARRSTDRFHRAPGAPDALLHRRHSDGSAREGERKRACEAVLPG